MPRSAVVITRQPSPQMKLPHQVHQAYQSPIPQLTSSASPSHSTASDLHSSPGNFLSHHSYLPTHTHTQDVQQIHPFVKDEQVAVPAVIPTSVKGAPAHLRPTIRKRQNSESAKRSRQRRKEAAKIFYRRFDEQCQRLSALEKRVAALIQLVKDGDEDRPSEPRTKQEDEIIPVPAPQQEVQQPPVTQPTYSDRPNPQHPQPAQPTSIVQTMAAMTTSYEEEQQDNRANGQNPFEDDLEALLETCIQSNALFGSC